MKTSEAQFEAKVELIQTAKLVGSQGHIPRCSAARKFITNI